MEKHITNKYFNNKDLNPSARISVFSTSMSGKTWFVMTSVGRSNHILTIESHLNLSRVQIY